MSMGNLCKIYLYSRYERFWHWFQTVLIIVLLVTGLEVHGVFVLLGFEQAVTVHEFVGITWLIAFAFFVFWLFTTGEWRQYIPTTRKMVAVVCHYGYGIFKGDPHPVPKQKEAKHNPLQRLTYLSLAAVLLPIQMLTGMLYWGYNSWDDWGLSFLSLEAVAFVHMACAFALFVFLIVHVYMTTTGHAPLAHIKAMITGWEEVEEGATIEEWEKKQT
ncbi:cytochrome b/b6 domain-containing protein [Desulfosudis oleivorans]|uniref:Cytochrome B561 n=1 Tax=Desulfosudis oleivorans (strain DSM 6200 / JCM 39069 / Hxd3) TaxID=96561 RepID=A8ZZ34_DESOH|nr:cytochrome b/b6 domain-containing protein [Desulfosudis oleivorans]ABW68807.1 cytochrome B561 [Desulfosudis oleivorans Hxd3]